MPSHAHRMPPSRTRRRADANVRRSGERERCCFRPRAALPLLLPAGGGERERASRASCCVRGEEGAEEGREG
jgi:hypothetical protein